MVDQPDSPGRPADPAIVAAQRHAAAQWQRLGDRIKTLTPSALMRLLLALSGIAAPIWLAWATWPAVLPFLIGAAVAYAVLPLVDALDRIMPRIVASLLATGAVMLLIITIPALILRVIAIELYGTFQSIPTADEIRAYIDDLNRSIDSWPEPVQVFVRTRLLETFLSIRTRFIDYISSVDGLAVDVLLGAVSAVGVLLGLLVLPVWILLAVRDQHSARGAINRRLPDWMEADFWAIVRILDRTFGAYIRGLSVIAIAVGLSTYSGLWVLDRSGVEGIRYPVALALLVAIMELIPTIGPIISLLAVFLITLRESPESALAAVLVVLGARLLVRRLIAARIERRVIDVHPAILIVALVALSQFGLVWALFAAPLVAILRDVFRYTYGRFSDPPRPAGVLPGEPVPIRTEPAAVRPQPLVYRRARSGPAPLVVEPAESVPGE